MYKPDPIDTSNIELSGDLVERRSESLKMFMKTGLRDVSLTVGSTVKKETMTKKQRLVLCRIPN